MKFKVGDKVIIRNDLQCGKIYGTNTVCECMLDYLGEKSTVTGVTERDEYHLGIDGGVWSWTDEMLENCEVDTMRFKVGDTVRVKLGLRGDKDYERELGLDDYYFNEGMERFCGKETVVTYVDKDRGTYKLSCDAESWKWTIGMLEPVEEEPSTTPTNEVTINLNKLNEGDRKTIQDIINKQKNPFDIPNHTHDYYYITLGGDISRYTWVEDSVDIDNYMLGNYYLTKEEAKFELEKRKIIRKLEILAKKAGGVDWSNRNDAKYYIKYSHRRDEVCCNSTYGMQDISGGYFPTEESLHEAIDLIGEDNIKKYIFGVED